MQSQGISHGKFSCMVFEISLEERTPLIADGDGENFLGTVKAVSKFGSCLIL